ncbi:hypothetical protein CHUAL_000148 [Chamberlinius hualienensis]
MEVIETRKREMKRTYNPYPPITNSFDSRNHGWVLEPELEPELECKPELLAELEHSSELLAKVEPELKREPEFESEEEAHYKSDEPHQQPLDHIRENITLGKTLQDPKSTRMV